MRLRLELFVDDLDTTIAFYTAVLGFQIDRRTDGYVSLSRGQVILGIGLMANLSGHDDHEPRHTWQAANHAKGAGVEIVLELDSLEDLTALYQHCHAILPTVEPLRLQPWGLHDFRLADPDGYYLRVTHRSTVEPGSLPT